MNPRYFAFTNWIVPCVIRPSSYLFVDSKYCSYWCQAVYIGRTIKGIKAHHIFTLKQKWQRKHYIMCCFALLFPFTWKIPFFCVCLHLALQACLLRLVREGCTADPAGPAAQHRPPRACQRNWRGRVSAQTVQIDGREEQSSAAKQCKKSFKSKRSDSFWKQASSSNKFVQFCYFLLRRKGFRCVVRFESKKAERKNLQERAGYISVNSNSL